MPLAISNYGRVQNSIGKKYYPRRLKSGYCTHFGYGMSRNVHILAAAAFNHIPSSILHIEVNHKCNTFEGRSNNSQDNIELSTKQNNIHESYIKGNRKHTTQCCKPIMYKKINDIEWKYAVGISHLANKLSFDPSTVCKVLKHKKVQAYGYLFKYAESENIPDENWVPVFIDEVQTTAYVSDKSRLIDTNGVLKTPKNSEGMRVSCKINNIPFQFSVVVWCSFNGVTLSSQRDQAEGPPKMQIDHIDHNRLNNNLSNLRQITARENILNSYSNTKRLENVSKRSIPIISTCIATGEQTTFDSSHDASRILNIEQWVISTTADKRYKKTGELIITAGYTFQKTNDNNEDLHGEVWMPLKPEHFEPYYFKRLAHKLYS